MEATAAAATAAVAPTSTTPPIGTLEGSDCLWDQQSFQGVIKLSINSRLSISTRCPTHMKEHVIQTFEKRGLSICRSSGGGGSEASPGRTYVDNSLNRRLGRVGLALGSMPVSRDSGTSSMASPRKVFSPCTISHFTTLL